MSRESVDSICWNETRPFSYIEWLRTPKRGSYKKFYTYTHTLGKFPYRVELQMSLYCCMLISCLRMREILT